MIITSLFNSHNIPMQYLTYLGLPYSIGMSKKNNTFLAILKIDKNGQSFLFSMDENSQHEFSKSDKFIEYIKYLYSNNVNFHIDIDNKKITHNDNKITMDYSEFDSIFQLVNSLRNS